MIKRLLLFALAVFISCSASAQLRYAVKDTLTTYTPLAGATSINGSTIWDDNDVIVSMPFNWKMDSNINLSNLNMVLSLPGVMASTTATSDMNGFFFGDMDIADRGNLTKAATRSPIRFLTTGTAPNRIFKVEFFNAGFGDELKLYNTMNDSFNLQIWIYETSNIVEYHFGPSRVYNLYDYFFFGGTGPFIGYLKHVNFSTGNSGTFYYVSGSPRYSGVDSFIVPGFLPSNILDYWPLNGEVFRFTPTWQPCIMPNASFTAGTFTGLSAQYTYTGTMANIDSLVWNFGDGQTLAIMSGFSTPVPHAFSVAGRYNVTVTTYTNCGSVTSAPAQSAVSVGSFGQLTDVKVYPNPATNLVMIEGLRAGAKATVLSSVGHVMLSSNIVGDKGQLPLTGLAPGSYILVLTDTEGARRAIHFVKQ